MVLNNITEKKYLFIINPKAGNGSFEGYHDELKTTLLQYQINYKLVFTKEQGDAKTFTQEAILEGIRHIIVVGGDGTLNDVVNGMFSQDKVPTTEMYLGIIPMGTGNDWARYYDMPTDIDNAIKLITGNKFKRQDIGQVEYLKDDENQMSYFVNIAGFGYDAAVVEATNSMHERGKRKKSAYLFNLLKCLLKYRSIPMTVDIAGEEIAGDIFSISIGNGKFTGGGMIQTPNANISDGILDVTVYIGITKWRVIKNISKLYNGRILEIKGIRAFKTKKIFVQSEHKFFAELDGELIGNSSYKISLLENALNIICK